MSINGIGSYQISASLYTTQTSAVTSDGDFDRSRLSAPTNPISNSGLLNSSISQTLFQLGVTPAAANVATGATPTNSQQQALNTFTQNLAGALQSASEGNSTPNTTIGASVSARKNNKSTLVNNSYGSSSTITTSSGAQQGLSSASSTNLEGQLQNLLQQLGAGSTSVTDNDNPALQSLQQSYQDLLSSQGGATTQPNLSNFLQTLAQNLQDAPPTGNLINTQA